MKLTFVRPHKSLIFCPSIELPDFVVLTGVNGAGKSHLLEAIENSCVQVDDIVLDNQRKPIRRFDWMNLIPQDSGAFAPSQITQERHGLWNEISQYIKEYRPQITESLRQLNRVDLASVSIRQLNKLTVEDFISRGSTLEQADQIFHAVQNTISNATSNVASRFVQNDTYNRQQLINLLPDNIDVPLIAFEEEDFYNYFPINRQPVDIFQQSFGRLFADYQNKWRSNKLKAFASSEGKPINFLTDEEFLDKYGEPPWDFVNSIFETANLDFCINQPHKYEDRPYEPILTERIRETKVKFADLSSGEKVLMSFALCLYYAQDQRQIVNYPEVLLFDEIDAPLHPSMTQSLLRTIQKTLVEERGIKVILTTHSPSTVALSAEVSLYAMYKDENCRLQKVKKDKALAILTAGVPTLSIDYENRRQVFVESQYDVEFYESIYKKIKNELIPEISLNFISSGVSGKGNCDQVREVVNYLCRSGTKTVYGIVDWDRTNNGNDYVKVLGQDKRYSIENYIIDPILLAAFLLREKWIERFMIGLGEHETYIHIGTLDNNRLQTVANFIVERVKPHLQIQAETNNVYCEYRGGQVIDLPSWFLQIQGHQLETVVKNVFPELKRFQREGELKREILKKVIDDVPSLISTDFISLFQEIQNVELQ